MKFVDFVMLVVTLGCVYLIGTRHGYQIGCNDHGEAWVAGSGCVKLEKHK